MVRSVFTSHSPLVGPYSRGFNHPGPMLYWLLAPLNGLFRGASWSTVVGASLLEASAIAATAWLTYRRAGFRLMLAAMAVIALSYAGHRHLGANAFVEAWNPYIAFPFFVLFLFQVWLLSLGERWQTLGVVLTGTLLVQCHIGYLPLVVAGLAWATSLLVLDRWRGSAPRGGWLVPLIASASALVLLWTVPVVQQLTGTPGNLSQIWDDFTRGDRPSAGFSSGAGIFAEQLVIPPPWLGGQVEAPFASLEVQPAALAWLVVPAFLVAVGLFAARRSGRREDSRLVGLAGIMSIVSIVAISRINTLLEPFLFYWRSIVAVFLVMSAAWAVYNWLGISSRPIAQFVCALLVLAIVVGGFGRLTVDAVDRRHADRPNEVAAQDVIAQIRRAGLPTHPVLIRVLDYDRGGLDETLMNWMDRENATVLADRDLGYKFGNWRLAPPHTPDEIWYTAVDGAYRSLLDGRDNARLVASTTPLRRSREREVIDLQRTLSRQLASSDHPDLVRYLDNPFLELIVDRDKPSGVSIEKVRRLAHLNDVVFRSGHCRCSVWAFPRQSAPARSELEDLVTQSAAAST